MSTPPGRSRLQGSISRHGNPRIRHLLVEAVWRLLRYQPTYHAVAKWREALLAAACSSARKKKIIVAIARQLAVDLWRLATGRVTAQQLGFATAYLWSGGPPVGSVWCVRSTLDAY